MSSASNILGVSSIRAVLSAGTASLVDSYYKGNKGDKMFSSSALKKAGFQLVSSFLSNTLEGLIRPVLPMGAQISSMYLRPLVVGVSYAVMAKVISGDQKYMYNILLSAGSEAISGYLENPVDKLLFPSMPNPTGSVIPPPQNSLSRTLG